MRHALLAILFVGLTSGSSTELRRGIFYNHDTGETFNALYNPKESYMIMNDDEEWNFAMSGSTASILIPGTNQAYLLSMR